MILTCTRSHFVVMLAGHFVPGPKNCEICQWIFVQFFKNASD